VSQNDDTAFAGAHLPEASRARCIAHARALLDSFRARTGGELLPRCNDPIEEAQRLFRAPFVVVSHGTEPDPVLNYGNAAALRLWEMDAETLLKTPSRLTAEATLREARERLLEETTRKGFVTGYEGVRISATGRRFRIHDVTIWNVTDASGVALGQAATFARWTVLGD
jgi:hypothetical protein